MSSTPDEQLSEEPQSDRGAPGSRDSGSDHPKGGQTDRSEGSFDEESVQSSTGSGDKVYGGTGSEPPRDAEPAVPPYDGRQETAKPTLDSSVGEGTGANTAGAGRLVADSERKAPEPSDTPRGATATPAEELPATEAPETEGSAEDVDVAHQSGVTRPEDRRSET